MQNTFLYIDPGTGSMLFAILMGIIGTAAYSLRSLFIKLKYSMGNSQTDSRDQTKQEIVIFSDHKRYWNVFEPVCDELEKRKQPAVYMTASDDDPALEKDYEYITTEYIGAGNKPFAKLNMLKANILLATTPNLDVFQWKRSRDVDWYVHLPHAASDLSTYHMFGLDHYDAILVSGDYQEDQVRALEDVRGQNRKQVVKVGIPYMDIMLEKVLTNSEKHDGINVLLAPSWGVNGALARFGSELIKQLLKTGYHIIIRPHPQSYSSEKDMLDRLMSEFPNSKTIEWNSDNNNFDVLSRSDIMISDFSGVIFDYSLVFDKPVIYTETDFNKDPYDAVWIDNDIWAISVLPKIGEKLEPENMQNLKEIIDSCLNDEKYQDGRDEARKEAWNYIGEGTVRVADYLMEKLEEIKQGEIKS